MELEEKVRERKFNDFYLDDEGILWISGILCIPDMDKLREENHLRDDLIISDIDKLLNDK